MVDYVFERHLSGGILLPASKAASTTTPIRRGFVPTKLVLALRRGSSRPRSGILGRRALVASVGLDDDTAGRLHAVAAEHRTIFDRAH